MQRRLYRKENSSEAIEKLFNYFNAASWTFKLEEILHDMLMI